MYDQEHQGRLLRAGPKPADAPFHVPRDLQAPATCVYDNGLYDGTNGYSNAVANVFGFRRTLLDDFTVPAGGSLTVEGIRWEHVWSSGSNNATSPFLEILFRANSEGAPGATITSLIQISSYQETPTGDVQFGRPVEESIATFATPQVFPPGTYWLEATIVGPENNFWLIRSTTAGTPLWANYDDFSGLEPGTNVFSADADLSFCLLGQPDIDGDGVADAEDSCPDTAAGDPVDEDGCSLDQLCLCEGNDGPWKNHGEYVSCFAQAAEVFVDDGIITEAEKDALVAEAAESDCGS